MTKTLHCPNIVGGNAIQLAAAERELGLESTIINVAKDHFEYGFNEFMLNREFIRWRTYFRDFDSFDTIHYNYGQTLLPNRVNVRGNTTQKLLRTMYNKFYAGPFELKDIERARNYNKYVTVTFQGTDARRRYDNQGRLCPLAKHVSNDYFSNQYDDIKLERIQKFDRFADKIYYLNPDLANYLPERAEFLPYCNVDLKSTLAIEGVNKRPANNIFSIVHAPTHKDVKGTKYIRNAISQLKKKYDFIKYIEITNARHKEVLITIANADLLIDQLLIGWYGGVSVEAMALGTPVVAFIDEAQLGVIPPKMKEQLPIISTSPNSLKNDLDDIIRAGKGNLPSSDRLTNYVKRWHNPEKIAKAINEL